MWPLLCLAALLSGFRGAVSGDPQFDPLTRMRMVLVPADVAVGSVIYRLRASDEDFDYPLHFELIEGSSPSAVSVESLPCTRYNSVCQANVVLRRRLEPGRFYDFRVQVRDTKGSSNTLDGHITATNGTTGQHDTFPRAPGLTMISEDARRGTELDYVIARKNPLSQKPVYLELWGSPLFAIRQRLVSPDTTEGTIFLLGPLDFETQSMFHLTVLAIDAFPNPRYDSRNIFPLQVLVAVQDVQDTPPVFREAPPVTPLSQHLLPGDIVVRVHAEDGDRGSPRAISYGLVSEGNPFTMFFAINESTGDISLARPLDDIAAISHAGSPILLTVVAEEIKTSRDEPPAQASTVQLAFIMPDRANSPPYFDSDTYVVRVDENSAQGVVLVFPDPPAPRVRDDDPGDKGVFSLTLSGNNGTFEVSPSVGDRDVTFFIRVRDNSLLDYETASYVHFKIIAQELGPSTNLSAAANITVFINDLNDNIPEFLQSEYVVELPENATVGTKVVQVSAKDVDTAKGGKVRYTQILGYRNTSLILDPLTGLITVSTDNHGFDREALPEYRFQVEARDNDGTGNLATVLLIIRLVDVNDETPRFERDIYEFMLSPNLNNFTVPAFIKAIDLDAEPPNNEVRYELVHGNYDNKFLLNDMTGELTVREPIDRPRLANKKSSSSSDSVDVYAMTARAYDLGVPHRASVTSVRVYPPESRTRTVMFVVPGTNPDLKATRETLAALTGAIVTIEEVRPYDGDRQKSVILANLQYDSNSVIDIDKIQRRFSNNSTAAAVITAEETAQVYRSDSNLLFWLLMFFIIIIACVILALILCCICAGCPLYMPPRKRVVAADDGVHLVVRDMVEKPSAKNTEWRRREAWSAEAEPRTRPTQWQFNRRNNLTGGSTTGHVRLRGDEIDNTTPPENVRINKDKIQTAHELHHKNITRFRDGPNVIYTRDVQQGHTHSDLEQEREHLATTIRIEDRGILKERSIHDERDGESIRRHEINRGSALPTSRDQLFIREGNTEILQLLTRGREDSMRAHPQYVILDNSGKDILMSRFMEEQRQNNPSWGPQAFQHENSYHGETQLHHSNTNIHQELLEESLKQQNALLRQILLEKERLQHSRPEGTLETQSLPGHSYAAIATQTDRSAGTQTDPRRTRSDRDESPSDDEHRGKKKRIKRKKHRTHDTRPIKHVTLVQVQRKIRTPIEEEPEIDAETLEKNTRTIRYGETRTSLLRRKVSSESERGRKSASLDKEVLLEITDSLDEQIDEDPTNITRVEFQQQYASQETETDDLYDDKQDDGGTQTEFEEPERQMLSADSLDELEQPNTRRNSKTSSSIAKVTSPPVINPTAKHQGPQHAPRRNPIPSKEADKPIPRKRQSSSEPRSKGPAPKPPEVHQSESDLANIDAAKEIPRYMQWYYNKSAENQKKHEEIKQRTENKPSIKARTVNKLKNTKGPREKEHSADRKQVEENHKSTTKIEKPPEILKQEFRQSSKSSSQDAKANHTLMQHSEYRYEHPYQSNENVHRPPPPLKTTSEDARQVPPVSRTADDDHDSGIAMTSLLHNLSVNAKRNPIADKKSVFTIAYDEMKIKQIQSDSTTPPY